jgi:hypothetical protein
VLIGRAAALRDRAAGELLAPYREQRFEKR